MVGVSDKCTEDIARERKKCSFSSTELTHFWDGGVELTERRKLLGLLIRLYNDQIRNHI